MIPEFRRGSVYDGLDKATNVLMQLSRGEFTADQYAGRDEGGGVAVGLVAILVLFFLFAAGRKGEGMEATAAAAGRVVPPDFPGRRVAWRRQFRRRRFRRFRRRNVGRAAEPDVPGRFDNEQ